MTEVAELLKLIEKQESGHKILTKTTPMVTKLQNLCSTSVSVEQVKD